MKIGLRGGHSPNCKGAFGILDEQVEVRNIYNAMVPLLHKLGHTVIDCNQCTLCDSGDPWCSGRPNNTWNKRFREGTYI